MRAGLQREHAQHDVKIPIVVLNFGALAGVGNVFQHQRMQIEALAELLQQFHLVHTLDIDPGDPRLFAPARAGRDILYFFFSDLRAIVIEAAHPRYADMRFTDMHGCTGR